MANTVQFLSVIWEECIDEEICIPNPFGDDWCADVKACLRLIDDGGTVYVEVEAFGGRWRYALTSACHTVYSVGILSLKLCIETINGGVRLVLQGCLEVSGIGKCWDLIAQDIRFIRISDLQAANLVAFGVDPSTITRPGVLSSANQTVLVGPLTEAEKIEVLKQPE